MSEGSISLEEIVARLGVDEIPEILEAAATPVRRGHHVALLAGEGSGKSSVIGLAVLEACDADVETLQALVLVPEAGHAWRLASAVQRIVAPAGIVVSCPSASGEEERPGDAEADAAHVLVGRPSKLLPEIRTGQHSISSLALLVLDGVADLRALQEWSSVEPILETLPKESRKLAISDRVDPAFEDLIARQLPRARRWPEELLPAVAAEEDGAAAAEGEPVRCALAPKADFGEAFERCVRDADGLGCASVRFECRDARTAGRTASQLAVAGLDVTEGPDGRVIVTLPGEGPAAAVQVGLPRRLEGLSEAFEGEGPRYAVVEPRHSAQLALLLGRLRRPMVPLRGQPLREALDPVRRYRMRVREAAETGDLVSELLILEPLFEEMGAVRVAAVLSALLRRDEDADAAALRPWADVEAASTVPGGWTPAPGDRPGRGRGRQRTDEVPKGARPAWTRLYFGVGRRDDARPGDLVGAITGETGIAGAQIGKIEIMGSFSLVDVDSQVADEVLRKLDGVQIRGRTVPVRHDRES